MSDLLVYEVVNHNNCVQLLQTDTIKLEYSLNTEYGLKSLILGTFYSMCVSTETVLLLCFNEEAVPMVIKSFYNYSSLKNESLTHIFRAAVLANAVAYYVLHYSSTSNKLEHMPVCRFLFNGFRLLGLNLMNYLIIHNGIIYGMGDYYDKKD